MNRKRVLQKIAALALCLTMAAHGFGWLSPACAAGGTTVYTFGNAEGPWRDLAAEHEKESKQREKERRKAAQKQAVLEKKAGLYLSDSDAYVNIAGGIRMNEPAIDLGIALAVYSSFRDIIIPDDVIAFGEIGLSGEVRSVSLAGQRVAEARKLGFSTVILPAVCRRQIGEVKDMKLVYVSWVREAIAFIRG